jgi:phosphoribosylformimino-5-aminoimidazole carboxamide ribotide isomerase
VLEIIPAIDLLGGRAVRLKRGEYGSEEKVAEDPVATARAFASAGAPRIHIVDLDGSKTGVPGNADVVSSILRAVDVPVQVGGGVRSLAAAETLFSRGASRLIVGTSAARDPETLRALLDRYGDRLIVGADAVDGLVAVDGWQKTTGERVEAFGRRMVALGARRFLYTNVSRDGLLTGVDAEGTAALARAVGAPVLASGGVAGIEDVHRLVVLQPEGVEGVIIGKAIYAGRLDLSEALAVASRKGV